MNLSTHRFLLLENQSQHISSTRSVWLFGFQVCPVGRGLGFPWGEGPPGFREPHPRVCPPPTGARLLQASVASDPLLRGDVICLWGQDSGDRSWRLTATSTLICLDCRVSSARPSRKHFQYCPHPTRRHDGPFSTRKQSLGWERS